MSGANAGRSHAGRRPRASSVRSHSLAVLLAALCAAAPATAQLTNRTAVVPTPGAATYPGGVAAWRDSAAAPQPAGPKRSTASPSVSILGDSVAIPQLGRTRRVWLYLPPGYATSTARYPVLYLHDGQNVFDAATSFAGEWGVDETLDSLHARGGRGAIVVAVDNGGPHRLDEYDPWKSANPQLGGGEGDAYVEFLVRTLKPYVDRHYRTQPDPDHTAILGSSLGGLISLYAALKYPDVFGRAGVFSCACWIAKPQLLAYARRPRPSRSATRFYFVSGAHETADDEPARDQRDVAGTLAAAGFPVGTAVTSVVRADGQHLRVAVRHPPQERPAEAYPAQNTHPARGGITTVTPPASRRGAGQTPNASFGSAAFGSAGGGSRTSARAVSLLSATTVRPRR